MKNIIIKAKSKVTDINYIKFLIKKFKCLRNFDAVVAGGWARDIYFGKTPKDVDIFVPAKKHKFFGSLGFTNSCSIDDIQNIRKNESTVSKCDNSSMNTNFREEVNCAVKYSDGYDIISVNVGKKELISGFDCSICQIWGELDEDDNLNLYCLEDFLSHKENIIYTYKDIEVREDHKIRLSNKYPEMIWKQKGTPSDKIIRLGSVSNEEVTRGEYSFNETFE